MNRAGKIALGCLLAPIGFVVLIVVFFSAIRMAGVPEPRVTQRTLEQDLAEERRGETVLESRRETTPEQPPKFALEATADPVQVVIDLDEVGNINRWRLRLTFEGDSVAVEAREMTGLPAATFEGRAR